MRDFEGRTFEFVGEVGGFYNIISEEEHQVGTSTSDFPIPKASNRAAASSLLLPPASVLVISQVTVEIQQTLGSHQSLLQMQVSMKLKLGERWDHNGTYMEGLGFRYQDHKIVIELAADDNMHGVPLTSPLPTIFNYLDKHWLVLHVNVHLLHPSLH